MGNEYVQSRIYLLKKAALQRVKSSRSDLMVGWPLTHGRPLSTGTAPERVLRDLHS